jgi:hypothetical protein
MIDIVTTKLYRTLLHSFMTRHFMRKQLIKILYRVSFLFSLCCMRQLVKIFIGTRSCSLVSAKHFSTVTMSSQSFIFLQPLSHKYKVDS